MKDIWGFGRSMNTAARYMSAHVYEVKGRCALTVVVPADGFIESRQLWRGKTLCVLVPEILDLLTRSENGAHW